MTEKRYSLGKIGCYRTKLIVDNETKHEMGNSVVVKRLNALHEENQLLKQRLAEQNDVEWLRNNTVWEMMPSNRRTYISTIYHRRNDE